jgi:UDP-N-acetylglucosamine 2-epimerase (non-hydrolysing)
MLYQNREKKYLIVFGTRPEAIKMAPLVKAFKRAGLNYEVCLTAQHREMLDQVVDFFELDVHYDLNLMAPNQSLNELSARIISSFDEVLEQSKPDWVFVHGDTTTSTMCALATFNRGIQVAHVEAGLRTFNKKSPFPEEINRQITGRLADFHLAPTKWAAENLIKEGIATTDILETGNTVIDALFLGLEKIDQGFENEGIQLINTIVDTRKKLILITGHRRENFGEGFEQICDALKDIARNEAVQIIYPVHLNPNVLEPVNRILGGIGNVHLIKPLDYPAFIHAMRLSYFIITDSGGVQEEAPALGKPVLVMRNTTERPEAVEAGTVKLVGTDAELIKREASRLLTDINYYQTMSRAHNPYGDGKACTRILKHFL